MNEPTPGEPHSGPSVPAGRPAAERTDQRGSRILSQAECHDLLAGAAGGVGHLGLLTAGAITVLPLNFTTWSHDVVIRLAPGATLQALSEAPRVAFTVDAVEEGSPAGPEAWSVLVQGTARVVRDPTELSELEALGLTPLVGEAGEVYLRIRADRMSGRRFAVGALARFTLPRPPGE